jgi:predicted amidohydrolase
VSPERLAIAQLGPSESGPEDTRSRIVTLIDSAADAGASLVCFPELALTPYFPADPSAGVDQFRYEPDDMHLRPIFEAARTSGMWVVLPFAEADGPRTFNSALLVDPNGAIAGRYRKLHIPPGFVTESETLSTHEKLFFAAGDLGLPVFDLGFARIGLLICYDRFFPEAARALAVSGAEILCISSNNRAYGSAWAEDALQAMLRTRAYENGCYVLAPGKAGVEFGRQFIGRSLIASPVGGQVLASSASDGDELLYADFDREQLVKARRRTAWARDRRPDQYGSLVQ